LACFPFYQPRALLLPVDELVSSWPYVQLLLIRFLVSGLVPSARLLAVGEITCSSWHIYSPSSSCTNRDSIIRARSSAISSSLGSLSDGWGCVCDRFCCLFKLAISLLERARMFLMSSSGCVITFYFCSYLLEVDCTQSHSFLYVAFCELRSVEGV
jgi:hypothetical protein